MIGRTSLLGRPQEAVPALASSTQEQSRAQKRKGEQSSEDSWAKQRQREKTVRIWLSAEPAHLNPFDEPDASTLRVVEDTVFESLFVLEPGADGHGRIVPRLVADYRVAADRREIRLQLQERAKFHDGRPLSAVDVQFSVDTARSAARRSTRLGRMLAPVLGVEMLGSREVRIRMSRPSWYVLRALAELPILPAHVYGQGKGVDDWRHARSPIGSGPFRLSEWESGTRIVLSRNDAYWGSPPAIERIELVLENNAAKALVRARLEEIDILPELIPQHYPDQPATPTLAASYVPLELRPPQLAYLLVNVRRPPFSDWRVRQAAWLLIDRQRISDEVYKAMARPIVGPVWPGGPVDAATPRLAPDSASLALSLLEQAGWRDLDGDGVREQGTEKLRLALLVLASAPRDQERALILGFLRAGGFQVEQRPGESAVLLNRLRKGEFDAALVSWRGRTDDDMSPFLHSRGSENWGGFTSPDIDRALTALELAWGPDERLEKGKELGELLLAACPFLSLHAPEPHGLVHRRVQGLTVFDGWFALRNLSLLPGTNP
ncbi:MAG: peptide ABC transporter substrate-binding protein [Pseudomonadota bacterium]